MAAPARRKRPVLAVQLHTRKRKSGGEMPWRQPDHHPQVVLGGGRPATREWALKEARLTVLAPEEETIILALRWPALLPLDNCLCGLQPTIPPLARSSLHRCLEQHGISRLPQIKRDKPARKRLANDPPGCFHIDLAKASAEQGRPGQQAPEAAAPARPPPCPSSRVPAR